MGQELSSVEVCFSRYPARQQGSETSTVLSTENSPWIAVQPCGVFHIAGCISPLQGEVLRFELLA